MTHPKPPDNFRDTGESPTTRLTVNGAPVGEAIDASNERRGLEIDTVLIFFKNSTTITSCDNEAIQELVELVAEDRKYFYGLLDEASKVRLELEGRLKREKEETATGIKRLKAVTKQSDDRAVGFTKSIASRDQKHSKLKKKSIADSLTASKKGAERELDLKETVKSVRKESKTFMYQLRTQEKENGKVVEALTISQRKLSELHASLMEVMRERDFLKKRDKTSLSEATKLRSKIDDQGDQKRAHSKAMAELAIQKQQLTLDAQRERQLGVKDKVQHAHDEKRSLIKYAAQIRGEEKAKDLMVKDALKKDKLDRATSRLSIAASTMNHQNYTLRGSAFPPPKPNRGGDIPTGGVSIPIQYNSSHQNLLCSNFSLFYYYRTFPVWYYSSMKRMRSVRHQSTTNRR